MFLSNASIKRPIAMLCLLIGLSLLGINSYRKLGVELFPKIDMPYITIVTVYPGASPEQLEIDVAKKIENQVSSIAGLKHITSSCMENVVNTLLEFELGVDVDLAATDVREKIDMIKNEFPEGVEDPKIIKFDVNAKPIINIALTGAKPIEELYDYADNVLRDKFSNISGVADVSLLGGKKLEVQILLDREKLAARGLTSFDVVNVIKTNVRTIPAGRIKDKTLEYSIEFKGEFDKVEDIGNLEIANNSGQRCYLRDIAVIKLKAGEERQRAYINGKQAVVLRIIKKSDGNAVKIVYKVKEMFDKISGQLPQGMELIWAQDDGNYIESTVNDAWNNVFQGILLTAAILFLFLYNLRSLIIVAVSMPLTIIIGLFFMQVLNFTLNISTLLAIGMSVGILVTNSIVVLEAIITKFNEIGDAKRAALEATAEVAIAVIASAATNLVVLFPIAMLSSMVGLFLRPLALTMLIMTIVSLFISFTLTPILAMWLLKKDSKQNFIISKLEKIWNIGFEKFLNLYRVFLILTIRRKIISIIILIAVFIFFLYSLKKFPSLGFSFVAKTDMAQMVVKLEFPTYYNIEQTTLRVKEVEELLSKTTPELKNILTFIGKVEGIIGQSSEGVYLAQINLILTDKDKRNLTLTDIQNIIRPKLQNLTDCIATISTPAPVGGVSSDLELELSGPSLEKLDELAVRLKDQLTTLKGIKDIDVSTRPGKLKIRITPKRAVLSDLRTPANNLAYLLRANIEGLTAAAFKRGDRSYDINVKLSEETGKTQIQNFLLPGREGKSITINNVANIDEIISPIQITRKDKQRISKLYANLNQDLPLGLAAIKISEIIKEKLNLSAEYNFNFTGMYERMAEGQKSIGEAFIIAIILLVLSLAAILESYKQPFIIMLTLPLTLPGVYIALKLAGLSISVFVSMSIVMLIGIVVNNAILIISEYNNLLQKGLPKGAAMTKASVSQCRPIIMITLAAVLGMLPLALGTGIGSELRNDIGMASVGGILVSGILTMIVIPLVVNLIVKKK